MTDIQAALEEALQAIANQRRSTAEAAQRQATDHAVRRSTAVTDTFAALFAGLDEQHDPTHEAASSDADRFDTDELARLMRGSN